MSNKICQPKKIIDHLHRIEGQVRSVEKMYIDKRPLEEIVPVVKAARASLDALSFLLISDKVNGCYDGQLLRKRQELLKLVNILFKST